MQCSWLNEAKTNKKKEEEEEYNLSTCFVRGFPNMVTPSLPTR